MEKAMRTLALSLLSLSLPALARVSAAGDDPSLLGKDAPALQTRDFLQSDGRTAVADFKGEVLLVERFATWCGPCIGQMPHLSKLTEEYGKKGFHAISITDEPRETVLKFLTQLNVTPIAYTMGCGGGAEAYPASGIPKAFLVGVDGKVIWEGHPGELSDKLIEEELKKVKVTDEMRGAAADKTLAYAESLLSAKQTLRGVNVLERLAKEAKGTAAAKKAGERLSALQMDADLAKELSAQRQLDKIVGGLDMPKEKLKSKERVAKADQLADLAKKLKPDAPATAELAEQWVKVLKEDWTPPEGH